MPKRWIRAPAGTAMSREPTEETLMIAPTIPGLPVMAVTSKGTSGPNMEKTTKRAVVTIQRPIIRDF
jgi:hypothetical protein